MTIRLLTAEDILDFHASRKRGAQCLAIENGTYAHLDDSHIASGTPLSYNHVTTHQGTEAQILFTQDTILEGDWFPLDENGHLTPETAAEMADTINGDVGIMLAMAVDRARELANTAERDATTAQTSALARAAGVARVVNLCGGNQSEAARRLGLDQSTVNKLIRKLAQDLTATGDAGATMGASVAETSKAVEALRAAVKGNA